MSPGVDLKNREGLLFDFLRAYLIPTLVGMGFILYCGANYAQFPGRGFGFGLLLSVIFTLATLGMFLWRYRDYEDV